MAAMSLTLLSAVLGGAEAVIELGERVGNLQRKSGITSDMLNADVFLEKHEIADIRRRRLEGLPIPDHFYERCHYWVNAVRARESLPALTRWTEFESCTDDMAAYDYVQYRDFGRAHAAMIDGYGCEFFGAGSEVSTYAQNSCPLWPKDESYDAIKKCTVAMWEEKDRPGVYIDGDTMKCVSGVESDCGHYYTLRGGNREGSWYNKYDRVACGFYIDETAPDNDALYINQNFGGPGWKGDNVWLCGGGDDTRPNDNGVTLPFIPDCQDRSNDYTDCEGDFKDLDEHGCDWAECDVNYSGPCEDTHPACDYFNNPANGGPIIAGECEGRTFSYGGGGWLPFDTNCRQSCGWCSCDDVDVHPGDGPAPVSDPTTPPPPSPKPTPEPTPSPTPADTCDPTYSGATCEDDHWACQWFNSNGYSLSYDWCQNRRFTTDGTNYVDFDVNCRLSCEFCACGGDAPTDPPVPSPTDAPTSPPEPTDAPTSPPEPTDVPTSPPEPTDVPTSAPEPTDVPTSAPEPTDVPTSPPAPTDAPTSAPEPTGVPTSAPAPVESPTEEPAAPACESYPSGQAKGSKSVINQVDSACDCVDRCAADHPGTQAISYRANRRRCWCHPSPTRNGNGALSIKAHSKWVVGDLAEATS